MQKLPPPDPLSRALAECAEGGETPLLLLRHGRTRANVERRFVGCMDVPLDEVGRDQAEAVCRRLRSLPRAALYSSPLSRAAQTAEPLGPPRLLPALQELDQGDFEGLLAQEVVPDNPEIFTAWAIDPTDVRVPGGETLRELAARVIPALEDLGRRHGPGVPVVIVTHQMALAVAVLTAVGLPFRFLPYVRQPNTALSLLGWSESGLRVHRLNDHAHLADPTLPLGS
ncbi:MAG TPA: histidine phosphatase family protein [Myxococcota bacterium]|nr:histidine phosphatase family protein [Myxococcota bacterium]